jgi:hypothetical protein
VIDLAARESKFVAQLSGFFKANKLRRITPGKCSTERRN